MVAYYKQLVRLWDEYDEEVGGEANSTPDFAEWAIKNGRWHPKPQDINKRLSADMADALRHEMRIDEHGIKYRAKICIKTKVGGVQLPLWADADKAPQNFMEKSVSRRRRLITGDCHQLKSDVDHFNLSRKPETPIQLPLDFTDDVAELEAVERKQNKRSRA